MNCTVMLSNSILTEGTVLGNTGIGRHWPYVACIPIRHEDVVAIFRVKHAGNWEEMGVE